MPPSKRSTRFLPYRRHRLEAAPVDPLGDTLGLRARVRRLGRHAVTDERLEPVCRPVEGVALGHVFQR